MSLDELSVSINPTHNDPLSELESSEDSTNSRKSDKILLKVGESVLKRVKSHTTSVV